MTTFITYKPIDWWVTQLCMGTLTKKLQVELVARMRLDVQFEEQFVMELRKMSAVLRELGRCCEPERADNG